MTDKPTNPALEALRLDEVLNTPNERYLWLTQWARGTAPTLIEGPLISDAVRLPVLELLAGWKARTVRSCVHRPRVENLDPAVGATVRPATVSCGRCERSMFWRPKDLDRWRECALCGDQADDFWTIAFGQLSYRLPSCQSCAPSPLLRPR